MVDTTTCAPTHDAEIVAYVRDLLAELRDMALSIDLQTVSYLIDMARAAADEEAARRLNGDQAA